MTSGRVNNFIDRKGGVSVACIESLNPEFVQAAYWGSRSGPVSLESMHFEFFEVEVLLAKGNLKKTDSSPDWPREYCAAHHEILKNQEPVAIAMVTIHDQDRSRAVTHNRLNILREIACLLGRSEVHERFKKFAWWKFRHLLDSKLEREHLWAPIALENSVLTEDDESCKKIRRLYSEKRNEWESLKTLVPILGIDKKFSSLR